MKLLPNILTMLTLITSYAQLPVVSPGVYKWSDLLATNEPERITRKIMEGSSPHFEYLEIHATTQMVGAKPADKHANEDIEELILVKEGTLKVTVREKSVTLGPGGVILLLPQEMHLLENTGDEPLSYYVMRYRSKKPMNIDRGRSAGGSLLLNSDSLEFQSSSKGGSRKYFDRPTAMCERFEMHVTRLDQKGPSHQPHAHTETEIILVISGHTEMTIDGKDYEGSAGDLYFINSELPHGIRNATNEPCTYFAYKWR